MNILFCSSCHSHELGITMCHDGDTVIECYHCCHKLVLPGEFQIGYVDRTDEDMLAEARESMAVNETHRKASL